MKKLALATLLFLCSTMSLYSFSNLHVANGTSQLTFTNDIVFGDSNVTEWVNQTVIINGSVTVEANATLILRNTNLQFNQSSSSLMLNSTGGQPRFSATNSSVRFGKSISLQGASASLTNFSTDMPLAMSRSFLNATGGRSSMPQIAASNDSVLRIFNLSFSTFSEASIKFVSVSNSTLFTQNTKIAAVKAQENSIINATQGTEFDDFKEENSKANLANCTLLSIVTSGSSEITITDCTSTARANYLVQSLTLNDNSTCNISKSFVADFISVNNNSRLSGGRIVNTGPVSFIHSADNTFVNLNDSQWKSIITNGNATVMMHNMTAIRMLTYGNADLSIADSIIQNWEYTLGNSKVLADSSILHGVFDSQGNSTITAFNCTFEIVESRGFSNVSIENSTAQQVSALELSNVKMLNSQLKGLEVQCHSIDGTFEGFAHTSFEDWNIQKNNTISNMAPDSSIANVTLLNMPKPQSLTLWFTGISNVTMRNIRLENLIAQDRATLKIFNSTVNTLSVQDESIAYTYWNVTNIRVADSQNGSVSGATVRVIDPKNGVLYHGTTDSKGKYTNNTEILASVMNGTGIVKSLVIEVEAGGSFIRTLAARLPGGDTTITLQTNAPWWKAYWYYLAIIIALAALIVFIIIRLNRT
jgi:hypothetical protein